MTDNWNYRTVLSRGLPAVCAPSDCSFDFPEFGIKSFVCLLSVVVCFVECSDVLRVV